MKYARFLFRFSFICFQIGFQRILYLLIVSNLHYFQCMFPINTLPSNVTDLHKIDCKLYKNYFTRNFWRLSRCTAYYMQHIICKLKTFEWIARWKNSCQEFVFRMVSRLMTHFRHISCRQLNAVIKMSQIIWFIDYDSS